MSITTLTQKFESWASRASLIYFITARYYADIIRKEIKLAGITAGDHVLFIGGGVCPFSAILLHQATGARVTVIDNNAECTPKARQVIRRLELDEHIQVLWQDGGCDSFDLSGYSVIHFALQVSPMEYVFSRIEKRAAPGTRMLVRRPKKHLCKLYCNLSESVLKYCRYIMHKKSRNIDSTMLYVKQEAAA